MTDPTPVELSLGDELAIDRTTLANERTLLAYVRSAMALSIAGLTILHYSEELWFTILGLSLLPGSVAVAVIGICRYRRMNRMISGSQVKSVGKIRDRGERSRA